MGKVSKYNKRFILVNRQKKKKRILYGIKQNIYVNIKRIIPHTQPRTIKMPHGVSFVFSCMTLCQNDENK